MNDLKFTTAGEYMADLNQKEILLPYFINESGLKIDVKTGLIYQQQDSSQCSPP